MRKALSNRLPLTCVSLFSGCGGLDIGLQHAGFKIVLASDNDPVVSRTYAQNFPQTPFVCKRIGKLSVKDVRAAAGLRIDEGLDLLAGGPPCPPFSKSRFYRKEKPRSLKDPVAAETIGGYLRLLSELRPRSFILENVKGLAYGIHQDALNQIRTHAERIGYRVSVAVLNAADFGVPQIRERCVVLGSLEGEIDFPSPTHSKDSSDGLRVWVSSGSVLADLDTRANFSDKGHFAGGKHHKLLREIPAGDNYLFFTKKRGHPRPKFEWRSRYWSFLLKLDPKRPSWTIQARRSNNMGPFHWRSRILRIEEIMRLQTFPDSFYLAGNVEQQWRQIGNAVPPLLGAVLGNTIAQHLAQSAITSRRAA